MARILVPEPLHPLLEAWKQSGRAVRVAATDEASLVSCTIDLSEYKLNLSDTTPVLWEHTPGALPHDPEEAAYVLSAAIHRINRQTAVAVLLPQTERAAITGYLRALTPTHVLQFSHTRQSEMLVGLPIELQLLEAIRDAVPLAELSPYQVGGEGVTGGRFFNRSAEVRKILAHPGSSYAVTGTRRIGKTSVLKETSRLLQSRGEPPERLVYVDCSTLDAEFEFAHRLVRTLYPHDAPVLEKRGLRRFDLAYFLERMKKLHKGTVTLLLDEFDHPLTYAHSEVDVRAVLRSAVAAGAIRLLAAGFDRLVRELRTQTSPLFMFLDELPIGLFSKAATREMVLDPLARLRVRLESPDSIADTLHALTRGHPLYLQYLCSRLLDESGPDRSITSRDIQRIARSHATRQAILGILQQNTDERDQHLLHALAGLAAGPVFPRHESEGALLSLTGQDSDEVARRLDGLVQSGFLIDGSDGCEFTIPLMLDILRGQHELGAAAAT
jgi:hypothetical protein